MTEFVEPYPTLNQGIKSDPNVNIPSSNPTKMVDVDLHAGSFQQDLLTMMHLPKAELMTFDGDPLKYWLFVRAFDNCVGSTHISDNAKLTRLLQYCVGKALSVIECCAVMSPEQGYGEVRRFLHERFGNEYIISKAWVQKVTTGPQLRYGDGAALRQYADSLRSCITTLSAMNRVSEVDNQARMVKVVEKLPTFLQGRWRKEAVYHLKSYGEYPDINQLVSFIQSAADKANDPVFGTLRSDIKQRPKSSFTKGLSSFQTSVQPTFNRSSCSFCSGDHATYMCSKFKQMSPDARLKFVTDKKICFNCFSSKHWSYSCSKRSMCQIDGCEKKHSSLLHQAILNRYGLVKNLQFSNSTLSSQRYLVDRSVDQKAKTFSTHSSPHDVSGAGLSRTALPIVPVVVEVNGGQLQTYAFLDSGSTNSFCTTELFNRCNSKGTRASLSLTTLTTENFKAETDCVSLDIVDVKGQHKFTLPYVFVVPSLPIPVSSLSSQEDIDTQEWPHLQDVHLPRIDQGDITILIGQDNPSILVPLDSRVGNSNDPYAVLTVLGWTLNGPLKYGLQAGVTSCWVQSDQDLMSSVEKFWKLDHGEAQVVGEQQMSVNDQRVMDTWETNLKMVDGHYCLPIPFKSENPTMPNNFCLAESRLEALGRKFSKNPDLHEKYSVGIKDLFQKGYAEKVTDDMSSGDCPVWYLPHHAVISDKKPDKVRIVFDCSAKYMGTSLNEEIFQGPDLTNRLIGVLLRFRDGQIAIMGDVEAMYHQVKVIVEHRNVLRFLWWPEGDMSLQPETYRMAVHLFGGIWSASCANFALKRTALDNSRDFNPETVKTVLENMYVDDCLRSVDTVTEAVDLLHQLCDLLQRGGFNITKWISNSRVVLGSVSSEKRGKQVKDIDLGYSELPQEKALGVVWNTESDNFGFSVKSKDKPHTKRGLLSVLSSVYDPFGFVCPVTLKGKQLFQSECRLNKGWDDPLEPDIDRSWMDWLQKLSNIKKLSIPRCLYPSEFGKYSRKELHFFSDASTVGYGAVAYLRMTSSEDQACCSFLIGKSRLVPLKSVTIPRLELSAAVLSTKLDQILQKELSLEIDRRVFWTDSMIVLHQIKSDTLRFQTFVGNRIAMIHETTSRDEWHFVDSQSNPADYASRGLEADEIVQKKVWLHGPDFLLKDESEWPVPSEPFLIPESDLEIKQGNSFFVSDKIEGDGQGATDRLLESFSSWLKLKKAVGWILRLKRCLWLRSRCQDESKDHHNISLNPLCASELRSAEIEIVRHIQKHQFPKELQILLQGSSVKRTSSIYALEPVLNSQGILCVGGRLKNAPIDEEAKHQMILPKHHYVSKLIAVHFHVTLGHSGPEHVLSSLKQRFWIIGARPMLKKILKRCVLCRRTCGSLSIQRMADLPKDRVTPGRPPFTYVGIDCFGPFEVKRGRGGMKRYGCLFTCLTTRAVHIEKLDSLDTDSFIHGLRRFVCRRGKPEKIRSDNATNFRGAQKELKEAIQEWNLAKIQSHLAQRDIEWEFNPPTASHMGGIWERIIRSIRKVLSAVLRPGQRLQDECLHTFFCEVEAIINSRPITVVSDSVKDREPLTPNHLLLLKSCHAMSPGVFSQHDMYTRRWRHVQHLANVFWKRWIREYLPTLQLRQKWFKQRPNIKEGDVVLITDENSPRKMWPLARVLETHPGRDGLVRSVL